MGSGVVVEEVVRAIQHAGDEGPKAHRCNDRVGQRGRVERVRHPVRSVSCDALLREVRAASATGCRRPRVGGSTASAHCEGDQAGLAEAFVQVLVAELDEPVLRSTEVRRRAFGRRIVSAGRQGAAAQAMSAAIPYLEAAESVADLERAAAWLRPNAAEGVKKDDLKLHGVAQRRDRRRQRTYRPGAARTAAGGGRCRSCWLLCVGRGCLRESRSAGTLLVMSSRTPASPSSWRINPSELLRKWAAREVPENRLFRTGCYEVAAVTSGSSCQRPTVKPWHSEFSSGAGPSSCRSWRASPSAWLSCR